MDRNIGTVKTIRTCFRSDLSLAIPPTVVSRMMLSIPKRFVSKPGSCDYATLQGKRSFADVVGLQTLRLSWIIHVSPHESLKSREPLPAVLR